MAKKRVRDYMAESGMTLEEITAILPEKTKGVQGLSEEDLIKLNTKDREKNTTVDEVVDEVEKEKPSRTPSNTCNDLSNKPEGISDLRWIALGTKAL